VNKIDVNAKFNIVIADEFRDRIGDLPTVLVGKGETWQSVGHAVGLDARDGDRRSGRVGRGDLEVTAPLEAEGVSHAGGNYGLPVGDEVTLVEVGAAVG